MKVRRGRTVGIAELGTWLVVGVLVALAAPAGSVAAAAHADAGGSLAVSINVSPPTATQGNSQTFTAVVSGGNGPFTYVWNEIPSGCQAQPTSSWSCCRCGSRFRSRCRCCR